MGSHLCDLLRADSCEDIVLRTLRQSTADLPKSMMLFNFYYQIEESLGEIRAKDTASAIWACCEDGRGYRRGGDFDLLVWSTIAPRDMTPTTQHYSNLCPGKWNLDKFSSIKVCKNPAMFSCF